MTRSDGHDVPSAAPSHPWAAEDALEVTSPVEAALVFCVWRLEAPAAVRGSRRGFVLADKA